MTLADNSSRVIFADTGYWAALADPSDGLRSKALALADKYISYQTITTELVLVELLDSMTRRGPYYRQKAVETVLDLQNDPGVEIVPMDSKLFDEAVERYGSRLDQRWSLTDCVSFLIMERRGIMKALAHDRDFAAAGFRPLLRDG